MDIVSYIEQDDGRLDLLARSSGIPILRLKRLIADPNQSVRYLTARRLCRASGGAVTMEALALRGPMRGVETYAGPLGEIIAEIASSGPTVSERLARAGVRDDTFRAMLIEGRVPRIETRRRIVEAFDRRIRQRDFAIHAKWRRGRCG